jgi:DNA-binding NarL/FixJ family response regulator
MSPVSLRILVVDDHSAFRDAARAILETHGFTVVAEAADLAGALDATRRQHPSVALVDIGLAGEDGFEVAEALRVTDGALQIVLVSSRDRADIAHRLERSAAAGFLAKEDLTPRALREILAGR